MFQFQPSVSESDALKARIDSKSTDSPVEQPENTEVVNVSEDTPIDNVVEPEAQANEEVTEEVEESSHAEEATTEASEMDDLFADYNGREINLREASEWEESHKNIKSMQADCTRKWQEASDLRKDAEGRQEALTAKESDLNDKLLTLEAMLSEETKTAEEIAEMREYEPEEYIKYTEKQSKLKEFVNSAKTAAPVNNVDMAKVSADLFANHPEWMENGKQSQKFTDDTNLMTKYAESRGIGQAELSSFEAKHYEVMLDAARYKDQKANNAAIEKKYVKPR